MPPKFTPSRHLTPVEALQRAHQTTAHAGTQLHLLTTLQPGHVPHKNLLCFKFLELPEGSTDPGQPAHAVYYLNCLYRNRDPRAWTHRNGTERSPVKQIHLLTPITDSQATLGRQVYLNQLKCQQAPPADSYELPHLVPRSWENKKRGKEGGSANRKLLVSPDEAPGCKSSISDLQQPMLILVTPSRSL